MLIYVMHANAYSIFRLPEKIAGNYMIEDDSSTGVVKKLVNVIAEDSKWVIHSNENVRIKTKSGYLEQCNLEVYNYYILITDDGESIVLYTMPLYDNKYIIKSIANEGSLVIGKSSDCDIIFNFKGFGSKQLELVYSNSNIYIKNLDFSNILYVNQNRIDSVKLESFDKVFILGFRFIICGNLIMINNSLDIIKINSNNLVDPPRLLATPDYNSAFQNYTDYYNEKDYFFKSPIFFKKINKEEIELRLPEEKEKGDFQSLFFTIIPTALMSVTTLITTYYAIKNFIKGDNDPESFYTTIVLVVVLFLLCFVWPFVERFAEKMRIKLRNKNRVELYRRYLKEKEKVLSDLANEQKASMLFNNPSVDECQNIIYKKNSNLFSLNLGQEQFLTVRLGIGRVLLDCNINYQKPDFIKEKDPLQDSLDALIEKYKYIDNAPLTFNLKKSIAFLNAEGNYDSFLKSIILQLISLHDYHSLKIAIFTSEGSKLSYIRNINHCWSDERNFRYVATNLQEAESLSVELLKIFRQKGSNSSDLTIPCYVIISDDINKYRSLRIFDEVIHSKEYNGFSLLMFAKRITDVIDGCSYFCEYNDKKGSLFQDNMESSNVASFVPELALDNVDFVKCIDTISNIPIKMNSDSNSGIVLPTKFGFLEMYNVGNVNQLNSNDRWRKSKIINSLAAPIGIDTTGNILSLDLHENKHGPHGLIAGMTGSGKSELIITYLLSLAVNYSPDEVQFVLIDYKGGGLAGAFENRKTGIKLPHLIGTITNLDTSEMNRTLVSIKSELQRRQKIFNNVKEELNTGTIDIYKYQGLYRDKLIKEPLSHLFIVCDEFAELKQQQPDFMDEIVSIARIGRSLGIHLILATQKPSGVVDDQVWSNSKFKICCRVQTAEDSSEMLRKPDAAYIKETGRFYLQIGYDEYYILAQSAYSGVEYSPSDMVFSKLDNGISFVNMLGESYKNVGIKNTLNTSNSMGEELINIVKYLIKVASDEGYKYHQLWLDNIPERLFYDKVINKYHPTTNMYDINPIIGEYDDPANQFQGIVTLPITTLGNTFIMGNSGSGKSTLLSTIIASTIINHNSDEVNFYIVDMGTEKLKKFKRAPQVGDVLTINDLDEIKYLLYMIQIEIRNRQNYYSDNGGDFISDVKLKKCPFPNIIVIIYDIEAFKEVFDVMYDDLVVPLTRNCGKYGIYFVVTGNSSASLGYSAEQNFHNKVLLNVSDSSDYSQFFENYPVIKKNPGRGIVEINEHIYEFQTCLFVEEKKEIAYLNSIIEQLCKYLKSTAVPVPRIPDKVTFDIIKNNITDLTAVPIGVNMVSAQMAYYNFDKVVNVISSEKANSIIKFINSLQKVLLNIPKVKVIILNALDGIVINGVDSAKVYDSNFTKIIPILRENINKYNSIESDEKFVIIVLNPTRLNKYIDKQKTENKIDLDSINDLIISVKNSNFRFILYDLASNYDKIKSGEMIDYFDGTEGIWIGNNFDAQMMFDVNSSSDFGSISDEYIIRIIDGTTIEVKTIR